MDTRTDPHITMTFLGTGTSTGVPVVACDCPVCKSADLKDKRLRTSVMLNVGDQAIVIDCGPDFRYQMIRCGAENLDAILFTHEHRDHIGGLDDIRGFNYVLNKAIEVYASEKVIDAIHATFPYIHAGTRYFGAPQINFHDVRCEPFMIGNIKIHPIQVMHDKMSVFGYRIGDLTYITDASFIPEQEKEKIVGSKVLVINALRNSKHISHYCLQEALEIIDQVKPGRAFITHMSHFIGKHEDVERRLPSNVHLAYDGLIIKI
ncbi:MAG: MBL fold metallo-hydrolase [Bacteroidales bacterium]